MSDLREERETLLGKARAITDAAKNANDRELSAKELDQVNGFVARVRDLNQRIKAADEYTEKNREMLALIHDGDPANPSWAKGMALGADGRYHPGGGYAGSGNRYLKMTGKGMAGQASKALNTQAVETGVKALMTTGALVLGVDMGTSPVAMGKPAQGLLDVIPVGTMGVNYSYLRQITRTNNAAPVAVGGTKPTSVYSMTRIDDRLRVVAHLSEGMDRFWLEDSSLLAAFISEELAYGLQVALENQVVNGVGTGENLVGLATLSGVQTRAFSTSAIRTARSALTVIQTLGENSGSFVLNPLDWEGIETAVGSDGHYVLPGNGGNGTLPVDSAARRLWGQPVALCNAVAAGTGWLIADGAVQIVTDAPGVRVDWSPNVGTDFQSNQLRARCEGRFGLVVSQPMNVVKMATA